MRLIAVGFVLAVLAGCGNQGGLAADGTEPVPPAFRIILPAEPKPWEKNAAEELEHYLRLCLGENRMTVEGLDAIVFHVGDTEFARQNLPNLVSAANGTTTTNYQLPT